MAGMQNMLLGIGGSTGGGQISIPSDGLISRFNLYADASDTIGSYTGISENITYSAGASYFNGSSSLITTTLPQSLLATASFSCWIYPITSSNYKGLFGYHNSTQGGIVGLQAVNGSWYFGFYTPINNIQIGDIPIVLNTWQHIVCIMSPTSLLVYVNGVLFKQVTHSLTFVPLGNLFIGRSFGESNRYFIGHVSNFLIYNRVLNEQEVNNIYAVGRLSA